MEKNKEKKEKRERRHRRARAGTFGTAERPRLCVFRSNNHIYAQLIDDLNNKVILSVSDIKIGSPKSGNSKKGNEENKNKENLSGKKLNAFAVGKEAAKKALSKGIKKVVFDRGGYKYHGRVKALAEGAREGGLIF